MGILSIYIINVIALIALTTIYLLPFSRNVADGHELLSVLICLFLFGTVISFFTGLVSAWKKENPVGSEPEDKKEE